jgi:hypothetical protein
MRAAWVALLVAGSTLVGLRVGRPVYYTDGARELSAQQLAGAGMLRWGTPDVVAEVPGPVAGRVAQLADGRLVYGRLGDDGTADLVAWDPRRAAVPPEPVYGLNTAHNELAPAIGADGSVWFASDRDGGAGGYDLYVAPSLRAAAAEIAAVPACNTALDETDPALHPDGATFVFVRSDRRVDGGNDGTLWRWRLGDVHDPEPLFGNGRARSTRRVERDPVFTADGGALWFVQKPPAQRLQLVRASLHQGTFDAPLVVGAEWGTAELRSPLPAPDGLSLGLLAPRGAERTTDLWYASAAREVYPWWPGQRWLEWLLLGVTVVSAVLLLLLHLGRRWRALDLVAQCLLLSLLLHLLLFLWLMGVEIVGSLVPGDDDSGGFQVDVIASASAAAAGDGGSDVQAMASFAPGERSLGAAAPDVAALRADAAALAAPDGAWQHDAAAREVATAVPLADAAAEPERRDGADATPAVEAAPLGAVDTTAAQRAAAPRNVRAPGGPESIEVHAPDSGVARPAPALAALAPSAEAASSAAAPASARDVAVDAPQLHDAPGASSAAPAPRAAADAPAAAPALAASAVEVTPGTASAAHAQRDARDDGGVAPQLAASAPAAALARPRTAPPAPTASLAAPVAAASVRSPAAAARGAAPTPPALREAPATAAPVAARSGAAGTDAPPRALQPVAAAAADGPAAPASASSAQRAVATTAPAPAAALSRPASALTRGTTAPGSGVAPAAFAQATPAPRAHAAPGLPRLAEPAGVPAAPRGVAPAPPAATPASGPGAAALLAASLPDLAPAAAAAPRPAPGASPGLAVTRDLAVSPPRTALPRGAAAAPATPVADAVPLATANAYSNRFGPAKAKALETFGGTDATERAVANGLRYLARIQNADGSWGDRSDYDGKYGMVYVGKTALCVLAFLGAGHTPQSATEHRDVVAKAVAHLLALQDDDGAFGPSSCYGHGIATYALAECYGITKRPELRQPLERALTWILDHQGPRRDRRNRGGWGYFSPGLQAEDDYARVSVSSWMIMALESARLSGIELPAEVLPAAREYLELAYDQPNGWFRYNHKPSRVNSAWPTLPASTPAAAFCLLLLGAQANDAKVAAGIAYTVERRPEQYRRYDDDTFVLRGQGNVYFWYYGTLACFLAGGDAWTSWNERLRTIVPAAQANDGSFPPIDVYAQEAGDNRRDRAYTTAMCVLCLEVYYRYFTPLLVGR